MIRPLRSFLAICALLWAATAAAQTEPPARPFSLALQAGISYSGWNLALVGQYRRGALSGYLGPSVSLNRGLPPRGPVGISAGLNYHIPSQKSWLATLVNLDYQLNCFHLQADHADLVHELHLSYGLVFRVTPEIYIVQQLGYGFFVESAYLEAEGRRKSFSGYDGLVRLRAGYIF